MTNTKTRPDYLKRDGESPQRYKAYSIYRDLGLDRTLDKAAEIYGCNPSLLYRWSAQDGWVKRCKPFDADEVVVKKAKLQPRKGDVVTITTYDPKLEARYL